MQSSSCQAKGITCTSVLAFPNLVHFFLFFLFFIKVWLVPQTNFVNNRKKGDPDHPQIAIYTPILLIIKKKGISFTNFINNRKKCGLFVELHERCCGSVKPEYCVNEGSLYFDGIFLLAIAEVSNDFIRSATIFFASVVGLDCKEVVRLVSSVTLPTLAISCMNASSLFSNECLFQERGLLQACIVHRGRLLFQLAHQNHVIVL